MQLMDIFSPILNDAHSGQTTPSTVGGEASGRSSVTTMNSSGAISVDTQHGPLRITVCDWSRGAGEQETHW
jgi:hypothetical protein